MGLRKHIFDLIENLVLIGYDLKVVLEQISVQACGFQISKISTDEA